MRILFVTPHYPPDIGGVARHVWNLVRRLSAKHQVSVVTCGSRSTARMEDNTKIFEIPSVSLPPYPYQTLSNFRIPFSYHQLTKLMKLTNFDVLHAHGHHYPVAWIALKNHGQKPSVLTIHGMYSLASEHSNGSTILEEGFNRTIFRSMLQRVDAVIGLTPSMVEYARKYATRSKLCYSIPNGVDVKLYSDNLGKKAFFRANFGLPQDKTIITFSGRFASLKGIVEMVEASYRILRRRNDVFFLLVGSGPLENYIVETLRGLQNVRVVGWIPGDRIHEVYIASDVLVMPSKWEALPITLIEAMAAGLHIVATPVGGVPETLLGYPSKTYVRGFSSESLVEAVEEALNHVASQITGTEERKAIDYVKEFDWARIASRVEKVYMALTGT